MEKGSHIKQYWSVPLYLGAGSVLGLFLRDVTVKKNFQILWPEDLASGIILGILAIFVLEFILYWSPNVKTIILTFSFKHAQAYLPLFLLSTIFFINLIPISEYYYDFATYFYHRALFSLSISLVIMLKVYNSSLSYIFPSRDSNVKENNPLLNFFTFEKSIMILTILGVVYFFSLLFLTNRAMTDDTHYCYNMIWNLSHGNYTYSQSDLDIPTHIFGTHIQLTLIPIAILFKLWPKVEFLILIQSLILSSAIIPIAVVTRKITGNGLIALAAGVAYFLHPAIQIGHNWGVVAELWGVSFLIWGFYFIEKNNRLLFVLFCLLAIGCKEVLAVPIISLCLWVYLIKRNQKVLPICMALFSVIWFFASIKMKNFLNNGVDVHEIFRSQLLYLLSSPLELIRYYLDPKRVFTVFQLMLSTGLLCLASPLLIFLSTPFLIISFLGPKIYFLRNFYFAPMVPFVILATSYGINNIKRRVKNKEKAVFSLAFYWISISVISFIFYNPFNYYSDHGESEHNDSPHKVMVRKKLSEIPSNKIVAITPELRSQVSNRNYVYIFPRTGVSFELQRIFKLEKFQNLVTRDADYVITDLQQNSHSKNNVIENEIQSVLKDPNYGLDYYNDGFIIFKRGKDKDLGLKSIYIDADDAENINNNRLNIPIDGGLYLYGIEVEPKIRTSIGSGIPISIYWKVSSKQENDFKVFISFIHDEIKMDDWIHTPLFNLIPPSRWRAGTLVKDSFIVPIANEFIVHYKPYKIGVKILKEVNHVVGPPASISDLYVLP
ncbi:DUF2079 domain-containing protein [Candidatus Parcubacteria bacterium]|nr:MAG: DUF2079 domain-containing protein [Candidatus Parcubacteria bacterium]